MLRARRKTLGGNLISLIAIFKTPKRDPSVALLPQDDDPRRIVNLISRIIPFFEHLKKLQSPQIMDVDNSFQASAAIHDQYGCDLLLFHYPQRAGCKFCLW